MTHEPILKGRWNELKGHVKETWGKLTDDELVEIEGKRDQLVGAIQKAYGRTREQVESEIAAFEQRHGLD